jgi:hypothetical protein
VNRRLTIAQRFECWFACACVCLGACAAAPRAVSPTPSSSPAPSTELSGVWAEYWAVNGGADTQRYLFLKDGRFGWLAAAQPAPNTPIQKQGTYALEQSGASWVLVLRIAAERFAACSSQCAHHDEGPRRVEHVSPIVERYEIGECAPNLEAQSLDARYACRAIGGRAFWRRAATQDPNVQDFLD